MTTTTKHLIWLSLLALGIACHPSWAKSAHHHLTAAGQHAPPAETLSLTGAYATVAFSPNGDAIKVIVKAIDDAKKQVLVQAYGFTSPEIIKALGAAKARRVDVEVILDKTNKSSRYSGATYLRNRDIPVWIDDTVAIAHNKVMVIDGDSVISGSFNFTQAAQGKNAENIILITHTPALARIYSKNWTWRKGFSQKYN